MTMKASCIAVFCLALMLAAPAGAQNPGWKVAQWVEDNAMNVCSKVSVEAGPCLIGMGIVAGASSLAGTCWDLHQAAVLARQDYRYFKDDIEDMDTYLKQMNTYIMQYQALIESGNAESFTTLTAYSINVLENGNNFMKAIGRAIEHEREVNRPTFNPLYGTWCAVFGCAHIPGDVDEALVNIQSKMKQALPDIKLLQSLAQNPAGQQIAINNVNADLQSQMKQISQDVQSLNVTLRSATPSMFLTDVGSNEVVKMDSAHTLMSFRGVACSNFTCWAEQSTGLGKKLRQQQASTEFNMHMAMLLGFVALVAVVGFTQFDTTQTRLARTGVAPQPQHGVDDRQDAPLLGNGPQDPTKPLQVTCVLVVLAVLIAVFSGIFAWSWAADLQLNNQIANVDRFATLSGSMQAALDAAAACGHTRPTPGMADFLKTMSDQSMLAFKIMIGNAEDALQSSKLI